MKNAARKKKRGEVVADHATHVENRVNGTMTASSGRYDSQLSGQQVRASRVPRFGPRVLVIALGVVSMVCAVACKDSDSTSTSKAARSATSAQAPSTGDVSAGETPAGKQFAAWLTAFNSGDRGALVAYHQKYFPYEVASEDVHGIDREFGLSQGTGGFHLKKTETPGSTSIVAILKERHSEQFARVTMEVDTAEPHRVLHFEIHPIPTPDEFLSADERMSRLIDDAKRRSLIDGIAKELQGHYVNPDVANRMITALRDHLAHGDYDKITSGEEFAATVTKDLRDVSHDLHLGLRFGRRPRGPEPSLDDQRAMVRAMNYGFGPIERMSGNVAHVVINGFPPIVDDDSRKAVADLMSQVADADALLVDLRNNGGGSPDTVALIASYLSTRPRSTSTTCSRATLARSNNPGRCVIFEVRASAARSPCTSSPASERFPEERSSRTIYSPFIGQRSLVRQRQGERTRWRHTSSTSGSRSWCLRGARSTRSPRPTGRAQAWCPTSR
jgi:hypothetical protein